MLALAGGGGAAVAGGGSDPLLAWGINSFGQLGDGTSTGPKSCDGFACSTKPVKVKLPRRTRVVAVAAGEDHSLALTSTGRVLAWGDNFDGQLGDGTFTGPQSCGGLPCSTKPVKVKLPKGIRVVALAAGGGFSLALTSTGQVLSWGFNGNGELGDGTRGINKDHPVKVKLPKGTKAVAVAAGANHGMALTSTGKVLAWGWNRYGQLGNGTTTNSHYPVKVKLPKRTKAVAVAAGGNYSLALSRRGRVLAWGLNADGELGDGTYTGPGTCRRGYGCSTTPVKVKLPKGTKAVAVSAGGDHSLALTSTGRVLAWGGNSYGQLGDANSTGPEKCIGHERCSTTPVKVKLPEGTKAVAVSAGDRHSLALTSTGHVLAWGFSAEGQLGNGNRTKSDHPVKVALPKDDKATAVRSGPGADHSLALVHPA
jgi:alpha-tubulin suppressor-like RCC1 family protein